MSGLNAPAFIHVMSTRASAPQLPIAKGTLSVDNVKNRIQLLFHNAALNQVTIISLSTIALNCSLTSIKTPLGYIVSFNNI